MHISYRLTSTLSAILLSLTVLLGPFSPASAEEAKEQDTLKLLDLYGDIFEKVRSDYVEEVSDSDLVEASINGMLTSLDPHSSYLNKKAFDEMKIQTRGEFGGLGIEVTMENGLVKVVSPIDDTPAFKAGIKAGDYINLIDGETVMGMTLNDAVEKMRGKPKTQITIGVLREGESEPLSFTITRDVIKINSVRSKTFSDIAYIRITSFSENTSETMEKELKKISKKLGSELKGVVLDLRNNPGGLLDQAVAVSDAFLERGEIVSTRGRVAGSMKRFNASAGDIASGMPMVVLINPGSASASEIVAGALQDHKRAVILGQKSFGKGSVQTVIPVPGDGAIRLTTSRYYTPSGRSIQAEGIAPDIEVVPSKIEPISGTSYTEADLKGHLSNDMINLDKKSREKNGIPDSNKDKDKDKSKEEGDTEDLTQIYKDDYQLARAIDLIRAIYIYSYDH